MREDELKEALLRLRLVIPDPSKAAKSSPSSSAFVARPAEPPPPILDDSDDPYAVARFREPKMFLPDHQRTFLRAIAVKARLLFCTWDVREDQRSLEGALQLHLFWREFLGDAPDAQEILRQEPAARIDVDLAAPGWYVNVPGERLALTAALVVVPSGRRLAESNVCLTPPARPAPPGPLWLATLPPSLDRRRLASKKVFDLDDTNLRRVGETDARFLDIEDEDLPSSSERARRPWSMLPAADESLPSSSSSSSSMNFGGSGRGSDS